MFSKRLRLFYREFFLTRRTWALSQSFLPITTVIKKSLNRVTTLDHFCNSKFFVLNFRENTYVLKGYNGQIESKIIKID